MGTFLGAPAWVWIAVVIAIVVYNIYFILKNKKGGR